MVLTLWECYRAMVWAINLCASTVGPYHFLLYVTLPNVSKEFPFIPIADEITF